MSHEYMFAPWRSQKSAWNPAAFEHWSRGGLGTRAACILVHAGIHDDAALDAFLRTKGREGLERLDNCGRLTVNEISDYAAKITPAMPRPQQEEILERIAIALEAIAEALRN